jgi:hypothetical protein
VSALWLTLRFACEVALVVGVVWWGWPVLGIVAGLAVLDLWGAFVGPKAPRRFPDPARFGLELVLFAGGTVAFASVAGTVTAVVFGVAAVATAALTRRYEPA